MIPWVVFGTAHPTITGRFSFSASSKCVCGATRGSGVQSSTSSSTSYSKVSKLIGAAGEDNKPHLIMLRMISSALSTLATGGTEWQTRQERVRQQTAPGRSDSSTSHIAGKLRSQELSGIVLILHLGYH